MSAPATPDADAARDAAPRSIPCPLCGGDRVRPVCEVTRYAQPLHMARCADCSLLHINPRPPDDVLDAYYNDAYYAGEADFHYGDERKLEPQIRVRAAGRLVQLEERLARAGITTRRVVEIGSSFGLFLAEASRRGWDVQGCEISPDSREWARETHGFTIHDCDLADAGLAPESVDVVTGSEVIEHLADPLRTLRAAYDALAPGGIILFSTGNEQSIARIVRGANWGYYMPGHVVIWSPRTLGQAFLSAGFTDVDVVAGDERGLGSYREFARVAGAGSATSWLVKRLRLGGWTIGAGMVVSARKPSRKDTP